jgi:hypothetical protein
VNFRYLSAELHPTAEGVASFLTDEHGLQKFRVEETAYKDLEYRPTLQAVTSEFHEVWVEINELPYPASVTPVVLYCMQKSLPVKLYVGFRRGVPEAEYKKQIDAARKCGVGAIEVSDEGGCEVIHEATLQSLTGLRPVDRKRFPVRLRSALARAETTFKTGDPAKGCSIVYDEIEGLSRKLALKIDREGWWTASSTPAPRFKINTPWATVMDSILGRTDFNKLPPKLRDKVILRRVAALTGYRNEASHRPRNRNDRLRRDRELRTRFESAVDVLHDFADGARPLRLGS